MSTQVFAHTHVHINVRAPAFAYLRGGASTREPLTYWLCMDWRARVPAELGTGVVAVLEEPRLDDVRQLRRWDPAVEDLLRVIPKPSPATTSEQHRRSMNRRCLWYQPMPRLGNPQPTIATSHLVERARGREGARRRPRPTHRAMAEFEANMPDRSKFSGEKPMVFKGLSNLRRVTILSRSLRVGL